MPDQQDTGKDTEIILGTGKLLGIFFGLVAICGTFFGLGYSVGRSSSPMALQSGPTTLASSSGAKPAAGVTVTAAPAPVTEATPPLTDQNSATNAPTEQASPPQPTAAANDTSNMTSNPDVKTVAASQNPSVSEAAAQGSITVQVAAVTKQEDADALVAALRRKNYPVFVPPSPSTDNLYHVQVGPFAELKDAEAMKSKLASDGYNAIVKK